MIQPISQDPQRQKKATLDHAPQVSRQIQFLQALLLDNHSTTVELLAGNLPFDFVLFDMSGRNGRILAPHDRSTHEMTNALTTNVQSDTEQTPELFALTSSRHFPEWLAKVGAGISFSTYQAGKLFFLGCKRD